MHTEIWSGKLKVKTHLELTRVDRSLTHYTQAV